MVEPSKQLDAPVGAITKPTTQPPDTLWGTHQLATVAAVALMLGLSGIIAWLVIQAARYKRADQARKEEEEHYRLLVENQNDLIIKMGANHQITFASPSYCRTFGKTEPEVLSPDFCPLIDKDHRDAATRNWERLSQPPHTSVYEERVMTPQGWRWFEWSCKAVLDAQGKVREVIAVGRDETEQKNLTDQLRQAQKMEAVGHLAGGVAHDFNNLLTIIQGHSDLLLRDTTIAGKSRESLSEISAAACRAAELTRQLLTFGRRQRMRLAPIDLNQVVTNLLKMLRRLIGEQVSIETHYGASELWIEADVGMVEQVIINLVVNARDAMPKGGQLTLNTSRMEIGPNHPQPNQEAQPGEYACLVVADTGTGMNASTVKRIFEPFFTTKEAGKGTGLGLATVYGIVKQHKGWIEVESELDQGSAFKVFLPITQKRKQDEKAALKTMLGAPAPQTVLLVEDEPGVRALIVGCLQEQGHRVLEAKTAADAAGLWERHRGEIALLITDMVMPGGITGYELAHKCRSEKPGLPVIISSGYTSETNLGRHVADEGIFFLPKPFNASTLMTLVRRSLRGGTPKGQ